MAARELPQRRDTAEEQIGEQSKGCCRWIPWETQCWPVCLLNLLEPHRPSSWCGLAGAASNALHRPNEVKGTDICMG